jgi:hypothetical protein
LKLMNLMTQIAWVTDIHLNFLNLSEIEVFCHNIAVQEPCALLVGGDILLKIMPSYPDGDLTVLCGHTHDAGQVNVSSNLHVRIGGALYGKPCLQDMLEVK